MFQEKGELWGTSRLPEGQIRRTVIFDESVLSSAVLAPCLLPSVLVSFFNHQFPTVGDQVYYLRPFMILVYTTQQAATIHLNTA